MAVLDDDDIAFAHWVEEFHRSASANPGSAIRTLVAEQPIEATSWDGPRGIRRLAPRPSRFPSNSTFGHTCSRTIRPFAEYAILALVSPTWGAFDETLAVVEDWDVILETALLCGVTTIQT